MDGDLRHPQFTLGAAALGELMPMFLWLDPGCLIRAAGPTLQKLMGDGALGAHLTEVFVLRRPHALQHAQDLLRAQRLRMNLRATPGTGFKGIAVPLSSAGGVLLNLSFGYAVREAVRDHGLSDTDFAATDLAIELLYLAEAKAAVMGEIAKMAARLRGAKARAEEQAMTDALTGLGNRRAMEVGLERLLAEGRDFALLHLDLDFFKQVNDTLGHAAGDHVLTRVAEVLRTSVRGGDLVARVGGDEFVILLSGVRDTAPIRRVGALILDKMTAPIRFEGKPCRVAVSIGAVLSADRGGAGAERLLADADSALYASKRAGRARLTFLPADGSPETLAVGKLPR
ncbi:MAG: GGDEF domain-containing protein [Pararhodobacter sp.]